jgi:hypothetical protein
MQPWALDAAYLQVLNSIDVSRVGYADLVPKMFRMRAGYGMPSLAGCDLERLSVTCLGWFAIRMWELCPDRHAIPEYRAETQRYISVSAAL